MKTIAVVEDNPDNMLLIRTLLEDLYTIQEYTSGIEAVEGIRDKVPDLVLLDISLPEMDGVAVLQELRLHPKTKHLPAIALTAHSMMGDQEKYLALGFNDYISKPIIDFDILYQSIDRLINQ
jgi:CheY-like chemotaxis protein